MSSDPSKHNAGPLRPRARRRVALVVPASADRKIAKAQTLDVDEVVVDLEDGVRAEDKTHGTRALVAVALGGDWAAATRSVRVNAVGSEWFLDDVTQLVPLAGVALSTIVVPKVESADDIHVLDAMLADLEDAGHRIGIQAQIESARGLLEVEAIAAASQRLEALIFGPGDYAASLGIPQLEIGGNDGSYPGDQWAYPRSRIAVAARANDLDAIDGPYGAFEDDAGLRQSASRARLVGCTGKWVIHPRQIATCREAFSPSAAQVAAARRVLAALADAERAGSGATALDASMLDEASRRQAQAVLGADEAHATGS